MERADAEAVASDFQKFDLDKLNQTLKHQKAEIERLRRLLDNVRAGNPSRFCIYNLHSAQSIIMGHLVLLIQRIFKLFNSLQVTRMKYTAYWMR